MANLLEISIARQKCLGVSGKVVLWPKHRDSRMMVPMFYVKLCNKTDEINTTMIYLINSINNTIKDPFRSNYTTGT